MAKKKKATPSMVYVVMVAIITVVAGVLLVLNGNIGNIGAEESVTGEAVACPNCLWNSYGSCDIITTLVVGEQITYNSGVYKTSVESMDKGINNKSVVKFKMNGQVTRALSEGQSAVFADGSKITVIETLFQDFAGGIHSSKFCHKQ